MRWYVLVRLDKPPLTNESILTAIATCSRWDHRTHSAGRESIGYAAVVLGSGSPALVEDDGWGGLSAANPVLAGDAAPVDCRVG